MNHFNACPVNVTTVLHHKVYLAVCSILENRKLLICAIHLQPVHTSD